jgi:predicted DNA-binding transcriptional regulator YafY
MRRADRLFRLVQILRRDRISTAFRLAAEMEVSKRTLYRDIADLMASGVPIESEPGVGYRLSARFDLPPMMFTADEVEALVLGARMVKAWGDPQLQEAASNLMRKAEAVLPADRHSRLADLPFLVPDHYVEPENAQHLAAIRQALRERRKLALSYAREDGEVSARVIQPLCILFWGYRWNLAAWCEWRQAFRVFRLDRISAIQPLEAYDPLPGHTLEDYLLNRQR